MSGEHGLQEQIVNPQPRTALQQILRNMAANKAAAADNGNELVFER